MAFSKAHLFDQNTYLQSIWSKAHAHPARIIILTHLLEHGNTPFYEIKNQIHLAATTTSQHLRLLLRFGIIEVEEKCPHTFYQLNTKIFKDLASRIRKLKTGFDPEDQNLFLENDIRNKPGDINILDSASNLDWLQDQRTGSEIHP